MKVYNSESVIAHNFGLTFIKGNPEFLVIGTFPTFESNITFDFFYSSAKNIFWKVLNKVFPNSQTILNLKVSVKDAKEIKEKNKKDREKFCEENKIALTDMVKSCARLNRNSKDKEILIHRYNPVIDLIRSHKSIQRIILTSKSAGSSAHHHFYQYLLMNDIEFSIDNRGKMYRGTIHLDRAIKIFSIDSTSLQNSHITESELIEFYKEAFNINQMHNEAKSN